MLNTIIAYCYKQSQEYGKVNRNKVSSTNTWKEKEKRLRENGSYKKTYQTNLMYGPYLDPDLNNTIGKRHLSNDI